MDRTDMLLIEGLLFGAGFLVGLFVGLFL